MVGGDKFLDLVFDLLLLFYKGGVVDLGLVFYRPCVAYLKRAEAYLICKGDDTQGGGDKDFLLVGKGVGIVAGEFECFDAFFKVGCGKEGVLIKGGCDFVEDGLAYLVEFVAFALVNHKGHVMFALGKVFLDNAVKPVVAKGARCAGGNFKE